MQQAGSKLRRRVGGGLYGRLESVAHEGWKRYLLARLTTTCAKSAFWQFQVFIEVAAFFPKTSPKHTRANSRLYGAFIGERPEVRFAQLLDEFPVLRRFINLIVADWLETVAEFLERFSTDVAELAGRFNERQPVGRVIEIVAGLSDPHHGGRCVAKVAFEGGKRLVYKPRSLLPEAHFSVLLERVNATDIPHPLKLVNCWDRVGYGWMEFVEPAPCSSRTQVRAFYWRAGVVLALVHLACGVDLHQENMIAAGEFPVLVDLETLWHPQEHVASTSTAWCSVLRTGFLPWKSLITEASYDSGALGSTNQMRLVPGWTKINQDAMSWTAIKRHGAITHLPTFEQDLQFADKFSDDVEEGFLWIGGELGSNNGLRKEFVRWLQLLAECPRRRVLRSSVEYHLLREQLLLPQNLRGEEPLPNWCVGKNFSQDEVQALACLDIPYITQEAQPTGPQAQEHVARMLSKQELFEQAATVKHALSSGGTAV